MMEFNDTFLPFSDRPNGNGRIYDYDSLNESVIEHFTKKINDKISYGEMFDDDSMRNTNLTREVNLLNISHVITGLNKTDEGLVGTVKILDTPKGILLQHMIKSGVSLCLRPRATGSYSTNNYVTINEIISFDFIPKNRDPFNLNKRYKFNKHKK